MAIYALDSSAVLAYLYGEEGHDQVEHLLEEARGANGHTLLLPFVVLMEVEYKLLRSLSESDVELSLTAIENWPVEIMESTTPWRRLAAQLKARFRLSLADAWIASLALLHDAQLVHKDPEFDAVPGLKALRLSQDG